MAVLSTENYVGLILTHFRKQVILFLISSASALLPFAVVSYFFYAQFLDVRSPCDWNSRDLIAVIALMIIGTVVMVMFINGITHHIYLFQTCSLVNESMRVIRSRIGTTSSLT